MGDSRDVFKFLRDERRRKRWQPFWWLMDNVVPYLAAAALIGVSIWLVMK